MGPITLIFPLPLGTMTLSGHFTKNPCGSMMSVMEIYRQLTKALLGIELKSSGTRGIEHVAEPL
jgi:hypothetical protein